MGSAARGPGGRAAFVTGLGIVSPLGIGVEELWGRLLAGERADDLTPPSARAIPAPPRAATLSALAGRLEEVVDARALRRVSNLSRYAVAAARLALGESGERAWRDEACVILGTCFGSSVYHFEYYERLFGGGLREASPLLFSESVMNAAAGHVALHFQLRGASLALVGGEEVGLAALAEGALRLRLGETAAALAGGADEYCDFLHAALAERGFVSEGPSTPYAARGSLPFISEGAAFLLLESEEAAAGRGAEPLVRLAGSGVCRGRSPASGEPPGAEAVERAVRQALADEGLEPGDLDLVVASAGGGAEAAAAEIEGLTRALGARRWELFLAAPKAALGEGFAATSAAQAVIAVQALVEQTVPPTPGDEESALLPAAFLLPRAPVDTPLENVLALSVNRRGAAAAVLFRRP
jgi:3-oxoacyl-(acyl-carrier-protein) synthase